MKAVVIQNQGGPEVMELVDIDLEQPGEGQIQVRHTAIGFNFLDIYQRSGTYPMETPCGLGMEASGVVEAVGDGVAGFHVGDRIAYGAGPVGAYAQARNIQASRVAKIPDSIDDETGAAMMLKGMTVRYLLRQTFKVEAGQTILLHAAAGGVGTIASQWAKALGATVIGTVGSAEKGEIAKAHGCDHIINYSEENVAKRVREITDGKGVPVVYDGVGQATLEASLDSLAPLGTMVSFGSASGPIENFNLNLLMMKGSLYITRPTLVTYVADDKDLADNVKDLIEVVANGDVKLSVNQRYPLSQIRQAHEDLVARKTTGTTIIQPDA